MIIEAVILAGACGFRATVRVETVSRYRAVIQIESDCPHVARMAGELGEVDVMKELFKGASQVAIAGAQHLPHRTCPVVIGILKALEVSAGLAVPKNVSISFTEVSYGLQEKGVQSRPWGVLILTGPTAS